VLYRQWKAKIIRRKERATFADVTELVEEIKRHKPAKKTPPTGEGAFCVVLADWQMGKEGSSGTVQRVLKAIDDVEHRVKELRKMGRPLGSLYVLWPGDSVEGCVGHYDQQTFTVELDRRDQVKVTRRLLRDALVRWSRHFERVAVVAVGGNHGENRKDGKSFTTFGDNDDLAVVEQVAEIMAANPEAYGHIEFIIPPDHLTVTVEVAGWIMGVTHGHVARESGTAETKLRRWYERMAGGKQPIGDADILVSGHYHHTRVADWGGCYWLQAPALDAGSEWWRLVRGEASEAGVLTFAVYPERRVADLEVL
jgi:predicted phosphodiesterase